MSDFEEYIKVNYPRDYERQKRIYPDQSVEELYSEDYKMWQHQQAIIDEHTEVIKLQDADLRKYEKQIESLKAQLNNMEACYIEKKKQVGELQGRIDEISGYATELAEYASYSEIIGAISHNREAVRVYCDKIFAYNRAIDIEEEKALRGES